MNRGLLAYVLNLLLIQKGLLGENLNAKGKNLLHLEKLLKKKLKKKDSFNLVTHC